jgi:predicted transcriptional regulator
MVSISIRVTEDIQERLDVEAHKQGKSKREIIETALREYFERCSRETPPKSS